MWHVLLDKNLIAIAATDIAPSDNERGLQFGDSTYAGLSLATAATAQLATLPEDFVGGKYKLNATADGLMANPAYVAPTILALVPSVPTRNISKNSFFDRIGNDLPAIYALAKTDVAVAIWLDRLKMAPEKPDGLSVPLDDPRTIAGVTFVYQQLEVAGSIAVGQAAVRSAAILG